MSYQEVPQPSSVPVAPARRRRRWPWVVASLSILVLLPCMVISCYWLLALHGYRVNGPAMLPALSSGDLVTADKSAYLFSGPSRGDVIVFHYPPDPTQLFIMRVIAIPGDTIKITTDQVVVDGVVLHEPYITQPVNPSVETITLKSGEYFVMGDNRPYSSDSRSWGPVPKDYIIGKALYAQGIQGYRVLDTYPDVFSSIH